MGFFLFRREGDHIELVDARVFGSRNEAAGVVARLVEDDAIDIENLFVVDTAATVPVVVVRVPATDDEGGRFVPAPVTPLASLAGPVPIAEPASMAKHAPEPEPEPELIGEPEPEPELALALEPESIPRAVVEVEEAIADAVLADALSAPDPEEQSAAAIPKIESEPMPPTTTWPWDEAAEVPASDPPASITNLLADLEEIAPVAAEPLEPEGGETPPRAYEAGGSDITELTCDDCIYLNTCPKKGESDPTSCGSFQWKSV